MSYLIEKIENQEVSIETAQLFGAYTDDSRLFNGLKITKESFLVGKPSNILPDVIYYISATILYKVKSNQIIISGEGGIDKVKRLVIPVDEMNIDLATFKQWVIDVNGGVTGGGLTIYGEFGTDALAAAGGVPIGGVYVKPDNTGFGGLLAIRRV